MPPGWRVGGISVAGIRHTNGESPWVAVAGGTRLLLFREGHPSGKRTLGGERPNLGNRALAHRPVDVPDVRAHAHAYPHVFKIKLQACTAWCVSGPLPAWISCLSGLDALGCWLLRIHRHRSPRQSAIPHVAPSKRRCRCVRVTAARPSARRSLHVHQTQDSIGHRM